MKPLNERIKVEIDNIETVIKELKMASIQENKTNLEISGIGALLHNFYSGVENILKQIFIDYKLIIPNDLSWHKELLSKACKNKIISTKVKGKLEKYLTFKHFFIHSYTFMLKEELIKPLLDAIFDTYNVFKKDIGRFLK